MVKKTTLLKLAERGSLRIGSVQMDLAREPGPTNPKLRLTLPAGRVVGYVAYHAEYRSALDKQIIEAINSSSH